MKNLYILSLAFGLFLMALPFASIAQTVVASGSVTNVHCYGDSTGSIAYQINGGVGAVHYLWNNGDSGVSVSGCTYTVHITNVGPVLDSFQVRIPVNLATGMNANFSNVEFTDTLGNVLPFWLQDFPTATTAVFWVRVPNLPIGVTNIYMSFCGTAAVTGNPTGTFEFFDNFDNNSLPLWTQACVSSMAGTTCSIAADNTIYFSPGYSAHLKAGSTCFTSPYSGAGAEITRTINPIVNDSLVMDYEDRVDAALWGYCSGGTSTTNSALDNGVSIGNGQAQGHSGSCATSTSGWALETSNPFVVTTGTTTIGLEEHGGDCDNSDGWFDDVRIRKYTSHMPTVVIDTTPELFLNNLGAGTYVITMTNNGVVSTDTFIVTQPSAVVPVPDSINISCFNASTGTAWVTQPIGGTPGYTFHWSNTRTTDTITNLAAGIYQVTVTDSFGCTGTAAVAIVQPPNAVSAIADSINITCFGQTNGKAWVNVTGGTPGYTYLWNSGAQTTDTISGLAVGNYTVTVTDAALCAATASVNITQPPTALTLVTDSINVRCFGGSTGQASVSVSGGTPGYTYSWNNTLTSDTIKNLGANQYTVTVTDTMGCIQTATVNVTQPAAIALTTDSVNVLCFGAATGQASVSASGGTPGYTYHWTNNGAMDTIKNIGAGSYTVTVTDTLGCTGAATVNVTQPAAAVSVNVTPTAITCVGLTNGAALATPSGGVPGYSYLWNNGMSSASITGLSAGSDTVTVTDANGCTATGAAVINPSSDSIVIDTTTKGATCGLPNGSITVSPSGGSGGYLYVWSNTQTAATDTALAGGTYEVTVTDNNGCSVSSSVWLSQAPALEVMVATISDTCDEQKGSASVTVTNGTPPYTYVWSPAGTDTTKLDSGSYTITVTDNIGCTAAMTFQVDNDNSNCQSLVLFPTAFTPNGDGKNDVYNVVYSPNLDKFQMRIYDRWGQMVFETYDQTQGWDGTFKGIAQPVGVYIWFAEYNFTGQPSQSHTGDVNLFR